MSSPLVRFDEIPWEVVAPQAREKRYRSSGHVCRILELSPGFEESQWCTKPHTGYVIDGEFSIAFRDKVVHYRTGDGICIEAGVGFEHKAIVSTRVTLFLVEPCPEA